MSINYTIERPQNVRLGIGLMIIGLSLFTAGEAIVKTLASDYDITQIVWARYLFHALVTFIVFSRLNIGKMARTTRPWLHIIRSALMLAATASNYNSAWDGCDALGGDSPALHRSLLCDLPNSYQDSYPDR